MALYSNPKKQTKNPKRDIHIDLGALQIETYD